MRILGIETSCDETGVALFETGRGIVAEALATQVELHARFGGVVPELASRDHVAKLPDLVGRVLDEGGISVDELDGIAYTAGPGLVGALMVGGSLACSLAYGLKIPAVPIHHMEGHLLASQLEPEGPDFPFLALLVSGGHTLLLEAAALGRYRILGETLDDAAGEAFDKVARLLGLPYPGGAALGALAEHGRRESHHFPRPLIDRGLDFSFSGLKTAARRVIEQSLGADGVLESSLRADLAASFEAAIVDTLVAKCARAAEQTGATRLVIAGGVGANRELRQRLRDWGKPAGVRVYYPRPQLCTDNGAMIAYAGSERVANAGVWPPQIIAKPRWPIDQLKPPA